MDLGILSIKLLLVADMNQINRTGLNLDDPPYWAELWPSAVGLARSLIERQDLSGMRVLEVGCGLGLPGIAAAKAGASVLLTDANPDALAFALLNAQRNGCRNIATHRFNWRYASLDDSFDMIIGSEVVYDIDDFEPISRLVAKNLHDSGRAVFAEPQRDIARDFFDAMTAKGFVRFRSFQQVEMWGQSHRIGIADFERKDCTKSENRNPSRNCPERTK